MKILSWNIWVDCNFDMLQEYLTSANADIVGLQEVKDDDPERNIIAFMTELGYEHTFAKTEQDWFGQTVRLGPAIFSKYPIIHSEKLQLNTDGNEHVAAYAQIKIIHSIYHVYSAHLVHTHQEQSDEQEIQAQRLVEHLPKDKVVLMGDFNATPASETITIMKQKLVNTDSSLSPTWCVHTKACPVCKLDTVSEKLDYIFVSKDLRADSFAVEDSRASDHLPISVRLS